MLSTIFADIAAAVMPVAHAEAPVDAEPAVQSSDANDGEKTEENEEEAEAEEEEVPDLVDPKTEIEAACETAECAPAKHHYDECAQRVTEQIDSTGSSKEDCVEEFFHLVHCTTNCAAPQLWEKLA